VREHLHHRGLVQAELILYFQQLLLMAAVVVVDRLVAALLRQAEGLAAALDMEAIRQGAEILHLQVRLKETMAAALVRTVAAQAEAALVLLGLAQVEHQEATEVLVLRHLFQGLP